MRPEVTANTLDDIPQLELRKPVLRDAAPAVDEAAQVPDDGPGPVRVSVKAADQSPERKQSRPSRALPVRPPRRRSFDGALLAVRVLSGSRFNRI